MQNVEKADVFAGGKHVGTLAQYDRTRTAFEYSDEWLATGFSISPFSLPLEKKLFIAEKEPFDGLFGVFDDTLPDGWGHLLTNRYLEARGIGRNSISPITRLCLLSGFSSGLFEYKPNIYRKEMAETAATLDALFTDSCKIMNDEVISSDAIDELYKMGGSSGGARPKANIIIDDELWLVKFPTAMDGMDAGLKEYRINKLARKCGIDIPDIKLIDSKLCPGFFASKRFDRENGKRVHMVSLSGLLESSHRFPALDYSHLMKALLLISESEEELWKAFRLCVFNIFIGNMDDHGKNFAFLYSEDTRSWKLAPAYDLTCVSTYYGEHSTTVLGKGKNIGREDLLSLADSFRLDRGKAEREILEIEEIIREEQLLVNS